MLEEILKLKIDDKTGEISIYAISYKEIYITNESRDKQPSEFIEGKRKDLDETV